jgi:hypothetical protein
MARLYSNENFPLPVVEDLRLRGHDVLTIQETGDAGRKVPDEGILTLAKEAGRALLTLNRRHFIRLHRDHPDHAGIVVCSVDPDPAAMAGRIHAALGACERLPGQLLRVNRPSP